MRTLFQDSYVNNKYLRIVFAAVALTGIFWAGNVEAGNFGVGTHAGYGTIKYEEEFSSVESEASLDTILFGVSGEYSFRGHENFFTGITTDWALGLEGREEWRTNGVEFKTDNLMIFGQFYDFRLGYKNSLEKMYYRVHVSGGWDGIRFRRDDFVWLGSSVTGDNTEDISLWRVGAGGGFGYKFGEWALDGRAAYSYIPKGTVENTGVSSVKFDTNGTCLDMGFGIAKAVSEKMGFYAGGSYTLVKLDKSDERKGFVFPDSRMQIIVGVVNLTYAF
jgi:hypothetical protein